MSIHNVESRYRRTQSGISFIELVMFIVIVSVGVAGILSVMTITTRSSADPLVRKQAIAVAESLLEEIELRPFTICDPTDPKAIDFSVTTAAGCTTPENLGPEAGETRYLAATPFNNVNDYGAAASGAPNVLMPSPPGILDVTGNPIAGLSAYSASVTITQQPMPAVGAAPAINADASLRIDVRVQGPGGIDITLTGYRLRYAPNAI
jgi:MSHA pilin protein MshD